MSRPLKLSIMLALALGSTGVLAQSLGQVQVKSNLDQPLLAEVPLLSQTAGDTRNMQVTLASAEAYGRAGVDRGSVPAGLQFTVVNNAQGEPVIRITSAGPVSEPYIDLLLDVKGGKGSVVREVTLLLDPAGAPAPAVAAPRASAPSAPAMAPPAPRAAAAAPAATPAPRAERPERAEPAHHAAAAAPEGSFPPVQKGQSLSTFAKQLAGHGGDMNQALLALQKANPDAFYRDNMNALKAGAVLRVPPPADLSAQSAAEASSQVRKQNEDWRGGAARAPSAVADAAAGNAPSSKAQGKTAEDRLALVPAKGGDGTATRAGVADGKSQAALASLKQELSRSQESLTALQQQGDELKSRVNDLEGINDKNQRLLSLKDNEIAELQHKLADARKAANLPPVAPTAPVAAATVAKVATPPAPAASVATPPVAAAASASAPAHAGSAVLTTTPLAEAKPAAPVVAAPKPAPHVVPPTPVPVAQDDAWYMQPIVWGAGAVVVIALAVLGISRRRRKPVVAAVAAPSLADRFGDEPLFTEEHAAVAPLSDEDDIDQRELLDELSEHPDDVGLHLELVSLYYERRDVDHFEAAAEAMYAHVTDADQAEWQEVVHMGEDLTPQHPLFAHGHVLPPQTDDEHAALEAFDISRYAETPVDDLPPVPVTPQKHSEYHFNFDLSPVQSAHTDRAADAARQAAQSFEAESPFDTAHEPFGAPVEHTEHAVLPPELPPYEAPEEASTWKFDEPAHAEPTHAYDSGVDEFSDDPVDTKLDLARAYLDMGDHDGARAMLEEVAVEGTQMQQDVARRMLSDLA